MTETEARRVSKFAELIDFVVGWRTEREVFRLTLPPWHCHQRGGLPVSEHRQRKVKAGTFRPRNISAKVLNERAARDYAELRAIPSLCTRFWSVDRFIPRRVAAP
jgi:hypothetical protein